MNDARTLQGRVGLKSRAVERSSAGKVLTDLHCRCKWLSWPGDLLIYPGEWGGFSSTFLWCSSSILHLFLLNPDNFLWFPDKFLSTPDKFFVDSRFFSADCRQIPSFKFFLAVYEISGSENGKWEIRHL